ncbi:5'-AMP-activated protein kinase beta subunit, interation domain-containing protein, partial [Mycena rebaudengoi]
PNAVDDQGFIANYVAVPGPAGTGTSAAASPVTHTSGTANASPTTSAATSATVSPSASTSAGAPRMQPPQARRRPSLPAHAHVHPDGSFWARSSAGSAEELEQRAAGSGGAAYSHRYSGSGRRDSAVWTRVVPEALVRAAALEEEYAEALAVQHERGSRGRSGGQAIVMNGFVPEPCIPPAPRLPRHLERLILNRPSPGVVVPRVGTTRGGGRASSSASSPSGEPPGLRVTTASGTDVTAPMPSMTAMTPTPGDAYANKAATHPQFGNVNGTVSSGVAVGGGGTPLIADDPSVLQTPSHAVLYHLCTSSIRDGMIAVGASTRYRQKYLTTVYYKPAVPPQREDA